uniref:Metal iron transporter n=1 Tax=Tetraselmis sp. GSL018 TaxID=582737 RepID=A0A061RQP1_9CHLO
MVPRLWHRNARHGYGTWLELLCANLGAAVCPPNFYLQSALVMTRHVERSDRDIRAAFRHNLSETALCLGIATAINVVMLILAGTVFFPERVVSLEQGAALMERTLGSTARGAFAVAMLCAGQSSSLSGVLSTQYIMEGFFQLSLPGWAIRLGTRAAAILPAFYVVFSMGPDSAAELIERAQVVVNFVVPFTVIPLTKFLSSELKMGVYRLSPKLRAACWASAAAAILLNLMAMCQSILGLEGLSSVAKALLLTHACSLYVGMSVYLVRRDVTVPSSGVSAPRR